jgi:excisionase family DNA binding protein
MGQQRALLSRAEAARYLDVSVSTLERWAAKGIGPKITTIGRRPKYRVEDLDAYLREGEPGEPS